MDPLKRGFPKGLSSSSRRDSWRGITRDPLLLGDTPLSQAPGPITRASQSSPLACCLPFNFLNALTGTFEEIHLKGNEIMDFAFLLPKLRYSYHLCYF